MYTVEVKPASKAGWFTPDEARRYYGKYARDGITVHWWGDGTGADNHDNIVNYLNGKAARGEAPSANYVLSDNKITQCVDPDNVAWTSGNGNATTIGIEAQPTLGAEGYKKYGWLVNELEKRYDKRLALYPHNFWMTTQCPGTLSLDRIRQEADKWARGEYNPQPTPTPTPPASANIEWVQLPQKQKYLTNKQPTKLWNFDQTSWAGFGSGVKDFAGGSEIEVFGKAINHTLNATYLLTEYSFTKRITNGFNEKDLSLAVQPVPTPDPIPAPIPPTPTKPEWELNLRDIDDTKMWFTKDQDLINIVTGQPTGTKTFKKDEEFVCSALTVSGGVEYRITDYSFKKGVFNGVPTGSLTLTAPGIPNIPPVPEVPPTDPDRNAIIAFLVNLGKLIAEFLAKFKTK